MNEKNQFLKLVNEVKHNLLKYYFFRFFQYALFYIAVASFFIAMVARWVIIQRLDLWLFGVSILLFAGVFIYWYQKRPTSNEAAIVFDQEVKENRVVTTFSFLTDSRELARLQRLETIALMKQVKQEVLRKQKFMFYWKELSVAVLLSCGTILSFLYPSEPMLAAKNLQTNKELLEELQEELADSEEKLDDHEKKELKKKLEQLKEQLKEVQLAEEGLQELLLTEAQLEEMKLELEIKEQQLNQITEQMEQQGLNELAQALKELNEAALQEALEQLTDEQKQALLEINKALTGKELGSLEQLTAEELAKAFEQLEESLQQLIEENLTLESLSELQQQLQQAALSLNTGMANAGLKANQSLTFSQRQAKKSTSASGQASGQQGEGQTSAQQGEGSATSNNGNSANQAQGGNGSGSGQGTGGGSGTGAGSGTGGNGSGQGGQGAGTGQGSRELVTVPNRLQGETSIEIDQGELGDGNGEKQQSEQAPVLKGSIRPYQEVVGHYEKSFRDSMNRMQLPRHLEGVVRDYFSELNLEQE